jgi:cytochrome c oxidase subunit 2
MRRGAVVQLLVLALVAGGITTAVAVIPNWLPDSAAEQAGRIHDVIWYVTIICIVIFAIVIAALAYSIIHFRAAPDDDSDGPPVHGHTGLEALWTVVPFLLVTSMAVVSAVVLARNDRTGKDPLEVCVTAQQFAWSFSYPKDNKECTLKDFAPGGVTSNVLRMPLGQTAHFTLRALDVIHSFWVPQFSQKEDAVPGIVTHLTITPTKVGTYPVVCTELCGLGHPVMRSTVMVMPKDAFRKWLTSQGKATAGGGAAAGAAAFKSNGCDACHTLEAAGATGKIGPDLDKLPDYAQKANQPLEQFIHESIVNPNAYVESGFPKGVMPGTFGSLPKSTLDALVQYLVDSSKGAK